MPQTATCYHNSLTLRRTVTHHVHELVFVSAQTFDACVALPLSSLHFFRLVFHALKVMMQTKVSQASRQARSCQTSSCFRRGIAVLLYYSSSEGVQNRDETRAFGGAEGFPFFFFSNQLALKALWIFPPSTCQQRWPDQQSLKTVKDNMQTLVIRLLQNLPDFEDIQG